MNAQVERLGPLGRVEGTPPQALVLGMHRSGTSALTGLLDRLGFYAGPDESLMGADDHNAMGYWELGEVHAFNEELLAALGGSWTDVLAIDPRQLGDPLRAGFLARARSLVGHLDSYGPWVIKDPRLCLLLPFWLDLLQRPLCILIHRNPLAVARSLARRNGLPIFAGIALWEHYNRAALAASQGLPRVLVGYRDLIDDPAATARKLVRALGVEGLRDLSSADARALLDSSLEHHVTAPGEELSYLNAGQRELLHALDSGSALLDPVPPLSPGAHVILQEHASPARRSISLQELEERIHCIEAALAGLTDELHRRQRAVDEREALLAAVFESRSWRLGFGLKRLLGMLWDRQAPTAFDRWKALRDS